MCVSPDEAGIDSQGTEEAILLLPRPAVATDILQKCSFLSKRFMSTARNRQVPSHVGVRTCDTGEVILAN